MFEKFTEKLGKKNQNGIEFADYDSALTAQSQTTAKPEVESAPAPVQENPGSIELKIARPESFSEVSTIADYLLDGCTVVLNMEAMERASQLRMLDFLNGVTYSLGGDIKNAAPGTFIITPNNVDIKD
ncbi:MAG: cell division protein SepF [Clostridia bacterium]|nr:cell division protein SepF [Clostridia bacterium]MBR0450182.1 cell division protein SepF [Clostridia bacterium]